MFGVIFLGNSRSEFHHKPEESRFIMLLPQILIVAVMFSIGIFPQWYVSVVTKIVYDMYPLQQLPAYAEVYPLFDVISSIGLVSVLFIVLMGVVFLIRYRVTKNRKTVNYETWGCGYVQPISKAQYTGRSYTRAFGNLMDGIIKEKKNYKKIEKNQLYPEARKFSTYYFDVVEKYMVMPMVKRFNHFLNYFQFIQNGKIQSYVIYGLFFILVIFLGSLLNFID